MAQGFSCKRIGTWRKTSIGRIERLRQVVKRGRAGGFNFLAQAREHYERGKGQIYASEGCPPPPPPHPIICINRKDGPRSRY